MIAVRLSMATSKRQRSLPRPASPVARAIRATALALLAVVIFIEEWGWRPLAAFAARLAQWPPVAGLEALIRRSPPRVALILFLVPAVLLFPVKVVALLLIDQGRAMLGLGLIVLAKVGGTALVGWLFLLVEPQLMQFAWFAHALGWWRATKERVMTVVRKSAAWRGAQALRREVRQWLSRIRDH